MLVLHLLHDLGNCLDISAGSQDRGSSNGNRQDLFAFFSIFRNDPVRRFLQEPVLGCFLLIRRQFISG